MMHLSDLTQHVLLKAIRPMCKTASVVPCYLRDKRGLESAYRVVIALIVTPGGFSKLLAYERSCVVTDLGMIRQP